MKIKNSISLGANELRTQALQILEAGLLAVDTKENIKKKIRVEGDKLCVGENTCSVQETKRIIVIGVGKCAVSAGEALEELLGEKLAGGIVLDVDIPEVCTLKKIHCFKGTHPMPSDANVEVTRTIVELLSTVMREDLVLFIISGGGSTLLCLPEEGATCIEEEVILKELFRKGATIQEINTIRKHMSLARGGFLAKFAYPAQVVSLIFSDVPGNSLEFVASGPTVFDTTTIEDADAILQKYDILQSCGIAHCGLMETPKEEIFFKRVQNILFVSNESALYAMSLKAEELGFRASIETASLEGEARDRGSEIVQKLHHKEARSALLYGGETTVTVKGKGVGGRNQELALGALFFIKEKEIIASLASDGRDNSDHAGALCDILTKEKADALNLSALIFLEANDSYSFFGKTGDYITTGKTDSNISDIVIALKE